VSAGCDAALAFIDGRLEEAVDMAVSIRDSTESSSDVRTHVEIGTYATYAESRARICLGVGLDLLEPRYLKYGPTNPITYVVLGHLGRKKEVLEFLEKRVMSRPNIGTDDDETQIGIDTMLLEASVLVGHLRAAELLLRRLTGTGLYTTGMQYPTCIARHLGAAAALLGRHDEAREHYQEGIRACTEIRFRPELALSRLQLAELLLDHYPAEKNDALEHLDFAIKEFREMKMQPSLERALRRKEILKA
jgi:tetratricopeptide (TPR) repeat protein